MDDSAVYVGIDIGWSCNPKPQSTGVATIVGDELVDMVSLRTDTEIIEYVTSHEADYVGIDAPLVVENISGRRPVEDALAQNGINAFPANRTWFNDAFGGVRGESIVKELADNGYELATRPNGDRTVIEVYPRPTIEAMISDVPNYKNDTKQTIHEGLRTLWDQTTDSIELNFDEYSDIVPMDPEDVLKSELKQIGDQIDAFYSALVLKVDWEGENDVEVFGSKDSGSILTVVP